jgi:hypothetical protein
MKAFLSILQMSFVAPLSIQKATPFKGDSKVVSHLQKSFDELLVELAKLRKDHIPLTMISLF